jgi:thiol-disulfide isomerase/thioredoxin
MLERLRRARRKAWVRWGMDALLVLAVVLAIGAWQTRSHAPAGTVPRMTLPSLDGPPVALAAFAGKPTLLVFWAPWCGVCAMDAPNIVRLQRWLEGRANVVWVASAYGDVGQVRAFVREHGVVGTVLLDEGALSGQLRANVFPTLYFLDAAGSVKRSAVGYTTTLGLLARLWW